MTTAKTTASVSLTTPASSPEPDVASWQVDDPTADAANPNATRAGPTRSEDESSNPPEALPSTSLEGGSWTGASDELRRVPVDESTTTQPTWMPRDTKSSGEIHEVARSHEEAAGDEVEGGEAGERICTGDDEERRARERIDDHETEPAGRQVDDEATDTPNPHAKCAGPTRPVGTSHDPADKLSGKREGGGVAESVSTPIEGRSGRMPTDRADEAKPLGDGPSGVAKVRGAKVQGGGYESGRDGTMNDASDESQQLALKALAEDGGRQCQGRPANGSSDSPEPPKLPDDPVPRRTESSSVKLDGERRAASSCDVERTRSQADESEAPGRDGDDGKRPMKPQTTSGRVSERSKTKGRKYLPGRTKVEPGDPGCEADASAAPWSIERVLKKPKKLRNVSEQIRQHPKGRTRRYSPGGTQVESHDPDDDADVSTTSGSVEGVWKRPKKLPNTSERERKRSKRRCQQNSPSRPGEEPEEPGGETVVQGDVHSHPEPHRGGTNDDGIETKPSSRDTEPRRHLGEPEASRGVEGVRDRGTVVDGAGHNGIRPSSDGSERRVETNAPCRRNRPGGHMGEPKASRDVEGDWSRKIDVDGVGYNGRRDGKDGATSSARCDSKRVETRLLAGNKGQYQQVERDITTDTPEASTPPHNDPRRPIELPNPPRRRGRIKSRSRKIRRTKTKKSTHRIVQPRRGQIRRIKRIGDVAYEVQMLGEPIPARSRRSTTPQRSRIQDRAHSALPEPRLTIYGHRSTQPHTDADSSHRSFDINSFHWNMKGIHYFVFTYYIPLIFPILFEGECC